MAIDNCSSHQEASLDLFDLSILRQGWYPWHRLGGCFNPMGLEMALFSPKPFTFGIVLGDTHTHRHTALDVWNLNPFKVWRQAHLHTEFLFLMWTYQSLYVADVLIHLVCVVIDSLATSRHTLSHNMVNFFDDTAYQVSSSKGTRYLHIHYVSQVYRVRGQKLTSSCFQLPTHPISSGIGWSSYRHVLDGAPQMPYVAHTVVHSHSHS